MTTVADLDTQEQQLKDQLDRIAENKKAAVIQERREKEGLITVYENEAQGYRNQAEKITNDADKQRLYGFAAESDRHALELRVELGLVSEQQVKADNAEREQAEFYKTTRKINALLFKALLSFGGYLIVDFTAGQLQVWFLSYVLTSFAKVFHTLFFAFGGVWVVCKMLFYFVSNYTYTTLKSDFKSLSPGHRVAILAALMASVFIFLSGVISQN